MYGRNVLALPLERARFIQYAVVNGFIPGIQSSLIGDVLLVLCF